ncbi:hypothetical protein GW17_00027185, partial [Ensete ventricosum]
MSINPFPSSLKSSEGSKSTTVGCGTGGGREGGSFNHHDERSGTLCSSWVNRLHRRRAAPPPPARRKLPFTEDPGAPINVGDGDGVVSYDKHTTSTDESRTATSISNLNSSFFARRYPSLFERSPAGVLPPRSPRIAYNDGGDRSFCGFGPYRIRSRSAPIPRGGHRGRRDDDGERNLGRRDHGEGGVCFPPFRRMHRLGEESDGERGKLGSRLGRQLGSVHADIKVDQGNVFFPSRRTSDVHNQVKLSPFFQFPPSFYCDCSIDKSKGTTAHPLMDGGNTKILDNRNQMRPPSNENWNPPLPISCFPSREVIDDFSSSRSYEEQVPVDPWCASDSLLHVSRIRGEFCREFYFALRILGAHLGDGAEAAAPTGTSYVTGKHRAGNEIFEKLGALGTITNLVVYLTTVFHLRSITTATIVNVFNGTTNLAPLLGGFLADTYLGRYATLGLASLASQL